MREISSIEELVNAVLLLPATSEDEVRSLEAYLGALYGGFACYKDQDSMSLGEFYQALSDAFDGAVIQMPTLIEASDHEVGFKAVEMELAPQLTDLREFAAAGSLENKLRYFGLQAASGDTWHNFDPLGYLECACAGTFHNGDLRASTTEGGQFASDRDKNAVLFEWDNILTFLWCGQSYE
jgi:hypothetical protein